MNWFFEKINKINKPLAGLTKEKRERTQINKIINEKGDFIRNITELHRIIRGYYEQLDANKLDNVKEMEKFLEAHHSPRPNQEEIKNFE